MRVCVGLRGRFGVHLVTELSVERAIRQVGMARDQTTCLQIKSAGGYAERLLTCDDRQQVIASALCGDALGNGRVVRREDYATARIAKDPIWDACCSER